MEVATLELLKDIAIVMFFALIFGYIATRLDLPAIFGYLLSGIAIGPFTGGLISGTSEVNALAELGVTLLLFVVGLGFSSKSVSKVWKTSIGAGAIEMVFMFILGYITAMILGWSWIEGLFLGSILAISSTIVIIKVLGDTGKLDTLYGKIMVGMLVVEDIGAIVIITVLTAVALSADVNSSEFVYMVLGGVVFLVVMLKVGKMVLPRILEHIRKNRSKELFLLTIFGACIGTAVVADFFGLSLALGAFVAGFMLAESEYNLDIVQQIGPLKDIFIVIFFVSIGMTIDPRILVSNIPLVLILLGVLITGKAFINTVTTKAFGHHGKTSLFVGLGMIQIGEFSFIMAKLGRDFSILGPDIYSAVITTSLVTMMLTPFALKDAPKVFDWLKDKKWVVRLSARLFPPTVVSDSGEEELPLEDHVLMLGYSKVSTHMVKALEMLKRNFAVVDYNPNKVLMLREQNIIAVQGDASNEHVLRKVKADKAIMAIVTLSKDRDGEFAIRTLKRMNPGLHIIARIHEPEERELLDGLVNDFILSDDVASRRVGWHGLRYLGFSPEDVKAHMDTVEKNVDIMNKGLTKV